MRKSNSFPADGMPRNLLLASILLVLSFGLALVFGAQTASWSWGPAMTVLGIAVLAGLKGGCPPAGSRGFGVVLVMATAWLLWRMATSEVLDDARADFLLLSSMLSTIWLTRRVLAGRNTTSMFMSGLSVVTVVNVIVALIQWRHPDFIWPYSSKPALQPTGFFGHYNYFANFTAGAGLLALSRALFARVGPWERSLHAFAFCMAALGVWLSGSRGGVLAFGVGLLAGLVATAFWAWRVKSKWLPVLVVGLPLVLLGGMILGWSALRGVQERRQGGEANLAEFADNTSRLHWFELAGRVAMKNPMSGGGSRSYAWQRNQEWNQEDFGWGGENEPFVHNELLQAATDYGFIGAGMVLLVLILSLGRSFVSLVLGSNAGDDESRDWLRIGVLSASAAVLTQANVSFVFHMLPSVLLLGLLLGMALSVTGAGSRSETQSGLVMMLCGVGLSLPLLWFGVQGTRTLAWVWPVIYSAESSIAYDQEQGWQRLRKASGIWPGYQLVAEEATLCRRIGANARLSPIDVRTWHERAVAAYEKGLEIHPYHGVMAINLANTYSFLGEPLKAEAQYQRALNIQGGIEPAFFGYYFYARHLHSLWFDRWTEERRASEALAGFKKAMSFLDESDRLTPPHARQPGNKELRKSLVSSIEFLEGAGVEPGASGD